MRLPGAGQFPMTDQAFSVHEKSPVCLRGAFDDVSRNFRGRDESHYGRKWRPQGDLNPCYRRERSLAD